MADKKKQIIKHQKASALPVKRTVNLAAAGYQKMNIKIMIPSIVLILLLAAMFSKFAVADRLMAASNAQGEAASMQGQLNTILTEIDSMGEVSEKYAHYTFAGFTDEELNQADRIQTFDLIGSIVLSQATVSSYSISGNEISLTMAGDSLEKLNRIAQDLENDERVDFCILKTASTEETDTNEVTGHMTVYLKGALEGGSEQ